MSNEKIRERVAFYSRLFLAGVGVFVLLAGWVAARVAEAEAGVESFGILFWPGVAALAVVFITCVRLAVSIDRLIKQMR
ncbi:MAG: hypothetical protein OXU29_02725 [Gammaproteobacteria bacterium]|nr:hypothetical protein [Gammaproteobacteria bacterium]MDD9850562.1 hypothetical protein [Gammaproteobacteria bacterium]